MTLPSLAGAPWLTAKSTRKVFEALERSGYEARAVGGSVRNALLGLPVKDIDIATPAPPEEVIRAAEDRGLKTIATGLKHGTVTVVSDRTPFEVTTLRRDEVTDGRHAKVAFTEDWAEDARRRDFTINALYCGKDGRIHDPLDGYPDIVARRVRFIGNAEDRIREDYLRILRFFRFTAEHTDGRPDAVGLAACKKLKEGIERLSGERLRAELLRILLTPRATEAVSAMQDTGVLPLVLGTFSNPDRLQRLIDCEQAAGVEPDAILRLGALALSGPGDAVPLHRHLRLSNNEYERLAMMAMAGGAHLPAASEREIKAYVYRNGATAFRDSAMLVWADMKVAGANDAVLKRLDLAQRWKPPRLPVNGTDVMRLGLASGPNVGKALSAFEDWWIASDFPDDATLLAAKLREIVKVTKA